MKKLRLRTDHPGENKNDNTSASILFSLYSVKKALEHTSSVAVSLNRIVDQKLCSTVHNLRPKLTIVTKKTERNFL